MESFHLAYRPAADDIASDDGDASSGKYGNNEVVAWEGRGAIAIRRASALRLYRCHRHVSHVGVSSDGREDDDYRTVGSSGNSAADDVAVPPRDTDNNCPSRRRAGLPSRDSSSPRCYSAITLAANDGEISHNKLEDANGERTPDESGWGEYALLAVLVPSGLTRNLIEIMVDARGGDISWEGPLELVRNNNRRIIDAESELRLSIHPCLCDDNERRRTASMMDGGIKSNEEDERVNGRQYDAIDEDASSSRLIVCGIITSNDVSNCTNFPADVVLLTPENTSSPTCTNIVRKQDMDRCRLISRHIEQINHDTASGAPWSVLKAFPVSTVSTLPMTTSTAGEDASRNPGARSSDAAALPCCPVCLNLIDPTHVGLSQLKPRHKCSRWCVGSNVNIECNIDDNRHSRHRVCANEMIFSPLPRCVACKVISGGDIIGHHRSRMIESHSDASRASPRGVQDRNDRTGINAPPYHSSAVQSSESNTCYQCGMSTTLWVCLTCGVVGCGRYTRKHAAEHYTLVGHPYSFELATGRIWDYDTGTFVHRKDLAECPVFSLNRGIAVAGAEYPSSSLIAPSTSGDIGQRGDSFFEGKYNDGRRKDRRPGDSNNSNRSHGLENSTASCHSDLNRNRFDSKLEAPTKKSTMISQEYEALLHSALEDQSQHYEGEISRLRATLASSRMQGIQISDRESREIFALQKDSERLKQESEKLSSILLGAQTKEAELRSTSQRLLREQSISKDLLERIRKETLTEHESGRRRLEDLEMQVADLTANLRMMSQLGEEERGGTICGTIGGENEGKLRGRKSRKGKKSGSR
ncbi:hypothetical protein ACHAXA_001434 [Cyclostephanos tholiformis]|uniref:UBP-type domain-containing protein n=1 Tax=Cyclostephanos tholiformis TaxID=382380 RepID=A0ABD3RG25_9STRA